jgi:integrase/recombinase XerD
LSEEKATELLALLPTMPEQDRAIIELLIEAGPRASELCSIVKENIYDDRLLVKGKTGERMIEISPHVRDSLRNLIPGNSGPIFWGRTNKPLTGDAIYRLVSKYLAQIGITSGKRGPHMLRHTMGRLYMASEKGDLESLRQQMGHTNISTTGIYAELNRKQVHKKFEAANPRERILQLIHASSSKASNFKEI